MSSPVVYRIQELWKKVEMTRDYSSLAGFGRIITVLDENDNTSRHTAECFAKMEKTLADVRDGDYILWAGGDPLTAFLAGVICERKGVNSVQWLRWDRKLAEDKTRTTEGKYSPLNVRLYT